MCPPLSNQVHDGPVVSASLEQVNCQFGEFRRRRPQPGKTARRARSRLPFRVSVSGACPETTSFLGRQPIPEPDTQFLGPLDTTYARGELGIEQPSTHIPCQAI